MNVEIALDVMTRLYMQGLIAETTTDDTVIIPAGIFLEHARALSRRLQASRIAARPGLDARFASGGYSRRLATGYLVEMMHFVRGASSHISAAIAHARDEEVQYMLSEYLEEEYWHGDLMERAVLATGLSSDDLERAIPLPGTSAVINSLRHAAHTDLLLYGALLAITESGPGERSQIENQFATTVAQGVLPEAAWRPYFEHMMGDGEADHLALSRALFESEGHSLSQARRDALRRMLLMHTEAIVAMEHAILSFYGSEHGEDDSRPAVHNVEWLTTASSRR